jgi:hypothetical protein
VDCNINIFNLGTKQEFKIDRLINTTINTHPVAWAVVFVWSSVTPYLAFKHNNCIASCNGL